MTARGWEDLSETIYLYEENGFTVDEVLVGQYLHNKRIAREFASYYDLYQKYKKDYRVAQILSGNADADVRKRAKNAAFDERIPCLVCCWRHYRIKFVRMWSLRMHCVACFRY